VDWWGLLSWVPFILAMYLGYKHKSYFWWGGLLAIISVIIYWLPWGTNPLSLVFGAATLLLAWLFPPLGILLLIGTILFWLIVFIGFYIWNWIAFLLGKLIHWVVNKL
jgi:hypothetical protein